MPAPIPDIRRSPAEDHGALRPVDSAPVTRAEQDPLAVFGNLTEDERAWILDSTLVDFHLPCTYQTPDGPCGHAPTRMFKEGRRCQLDAPQAYSVMPEEER